MSPYRFRKKVQQYGYALLIVIILTPKITLLITGEKTTGEYFGYKRNKATIHSIGYNTSIVKYQVESNSYFIEVSDLIVDNKDKNISIVYDSSNPDNASIRTVSGLFLMNIIISITACIIWWGITDLFLKNQ